MPLPHQMILASAGSGKTFQLTNRLITLIRAGIEPRKIIALTFSRNAAAEFLESIMTRLSEAGKSARKAAELGEHTRFAADANLTTADCSALLRQVLDNLHQLHLETLDSFFFQVVNAFPLELGIEGAPSILQGGDVERAQRDVIRSQLRYEAIDDERRRAFFETFKTASYGSDEKRVMSQLQRYISQHYSFYLSHSVEALWGDAHTIGLSTEVGYLLSDDSFRAEVKRLSEDAETVFIQQNISRQFLDGFQKCIQSLDTWYPGKFAEICKGTIPKALFESAYKDGPLSITYRKKEYEIREHYAVVLRRCLRHILAAELTIRLQATSALYQLLHQFAQLYQREVRNAGALTFDDVRMLLIPAGDEASNRLSLSTVSDVDRLFIDYRLDARFDHWLLDEFQDTSREQWAVLENIIDEVVQAPVGQKSFFYVGDVKQAIYNWRGGDHRLFMEIYNHYSNRRPNHIERLDLTRTYRCSRAVVAMANEIFGQIAALDCGNDTLRNTAFGDAQKEWETVWVAHESATNKEGYAVWIETEKGAGNQEQSDEEPSETDAPVLTATPVAEEVYERLIALRPWENRLSCAIICRTNKMVDTLTRYLRAKGIPVAAESDVAFATADPFSVALISLFQTVAHPGDSLAAMHLRLTPLADLLIRNPDLPDTLDAVICRRGFAAAIDFILQMLREIRFPISDFICDRLLLWRRYAAAYDSNGIRDTDAFIQYIKTCRVQEVAGANTVRVLTLHKSKGLGFDCVLLPEIASTGRNDSTAFLAGKNINGEEWLCSGVSGALAECIESLSKATVAAHARAWFEDFCDLYVAITRAKSALYIITENRRTGKGAPSRTRDALWILENTIGGKTEDGDDDFPRVRWDNGKSAWIN